MTDGTKINGEADMDAVINRIKKLLALGQNNDNEHQAALAMAKVQEMLEAYNLDMSVLGSSGKGPQRKDTQRKGGLYSWQRKLWQNVAELNFCYYLSLKGLAKGSVYEHRLIGSHANVIATEVMASYLQSAIERMAQAWAKEQGYGSVFVRDAIAYREGMAERISQKLQDRRATQIEKARVAEEERKRDEARTGIVTGNALTIVNVISDEADFNNDYLQGWEMGTTARNRHDSDMRSKEWQRKRAEAQAAQDAWDLLHPHEAAARKAREIIEVNAYWDKIAADQAKRKPRKEPIYRERAQTAEEQRRGTYGYSVGYDEGAKVGIDTQVDQAKTKRIG